MEETYMRKRKARVAPSSGEESRLGLDNVAFEMDSVKSTDLYNQLQQGVENNIQAIKTIVKVKRDFSKWKQYVNTRRQSHSSISTPGEKGIEHAMKGGIGLADIHESFTTRISKEGRNVDIKAMEVQEMSLAANRSLLQYFAKLGQNNDMQERVNLDFIESLLNSGADINCTDKFKQTILHEVARGWHVDVARFLLEKGANVNQPDKYGRTPLHSASAVDYAEMVNFLIENGADKEARTSGESQTPVHYAAKNDACFSLKALMKQGCDIMDARDYKGRTPIHVAAELDRSESCKFLLLMEAPVTVSDDQGQKAITWMITKMAPVAASALDQFRETDRASRKQRHKLNHLFQKESIPVKGQIKSECQGPLLVTANYLQYTLIKHPSFLRLLDVMWKQFGAKGAWINLILNFFYIVLWTIIGVAIEYDERYMYIFPDHSWRIALLLAAVGLTVWQIVEELRDYRSSKLSHTRWMEWRRKEIERDRQFCHPRWPDEEKFLERELNALKDVNLGYFSDMWNVFDWTCYTLLVICLVTHLVDIGFHSEHLARWHIRFMCVTIILLWLRLMKNARAFTLLGPFIVMLGHMATDCLRFTFLYLEFYIPYACAFWMIFGGNRRAEADINDLTKGETVVVSGYQYPGQVLFSLFRLTLVDDYDFDNMYLVDSVMATILVWSWLALSAILCLNLFIALLSDTFQRIFDRAQENHYMQRAISMISIWDRLSKKKKLKFQKYIDDNCSPTEDYYDDDLSEQGDDDMKKVTIQIKETLEDMQEQWKLHFGQVEEQLLSEGSTTNRSITSIRKTNVGVVTNKKLDMEVEKIHQLIADVRLQQDQMASTFKHDIKAVKIMLKELTGRRPMVAVGEDTTRGDEYDPRQLSGMSTVNVSKSRRFSQRPLTSGMTTMPVDNYSTTLPFQPTETEQVEVRTARFASGEFPDLPRDDSVA